MQPLQRPIHARFTPNEDPLANRQPYVPSYGQPPSPVDQSQNTPSFYYSNQQQPAPGAGAIRPSYLPNPQGSPDQPPVSKRRVSESSATSSRRPNGHVRTMSERPRKVYDAPITYGQSQTTAAQSAAHRTKSKRRNSESQRVSPQTPSAKRESLLDYGSGHIFISLSSSNVLKLKHVPRTIPDNVLLDAIVALWRNGIQSSQRKGSDWQINLHGSPWTCKGELGFQARRLVVILFQILGDSGYNYVSAVTAEGLSGSPTLIFAATPTFYPSHFFCMAFSGSRKKLYVIDAPELLLQVVVATIRSNFKEATEGGWLARGIYGIELTTTKIQRQDLPHQLANILHAVGINGYRLDASVSMGREGLFGISGRREVWMFRSYSPMPGVMYT